MECDPIYNLIDGLTYIKNVAKGYEDHVNLFSNNEMIYVALRNTKLSDDWDWDHLKPYMEKLGWEWLADDECFGFRT